MILLLIGILLIIGGILFQIFGDSYTVGNWICYIFGGFFLLIFFIGVMLVPINGKKGIEKYNEVTYYLSEMEDVAYFSKEERTISVSFINTMNKRIRVNRIFKNNFWIGCFYYKPFGELEILSYKKVVEHNNRITVEGL